MKTKQSFKAARSVTEKKVVNLLMENCTRVIPSLPSPQGDNNCNTYNPSLFSRTQQASSN